jgi:hypothetical protein
MIDGAELEEVLGDWDSNAGDDVVTNEEPVEQPGSAR